MKRNACKRNGKFHNNWVAIMYLFRNVSDRNNFVFCYFPIINIYIRNLSECS